MTVPTYLTNKKKIIESKYHQVTKRFESKYELIHRKVALRFHRGTNETELIRSKINNLITKSKISIESKNNSERFINVLDRKSTKRIDKFYPSIIDWIQGRFLGQTIRIVVREGKIIEKVLLSPKGSRISVKGIELGFRFRSIPVIKIKLSLWLRSMSIIQRSLILIDKKGI